jgi:hypothetical protein
MDFINNTPIPACIKLGEVDAASPVFCQVTAKATFRFDVVGKVELDTQNPYPIFEKDEETELGILPSDELPHPNNTFSVIALSFAYSDGTSTQRIVSLKVGDVRRELLVTGDRYWHDDGTMGEAEPFKRIPVTYERAFGGTVNIMLDETTRLPVPWPLNSKGIGFDPSTDFEVFAETIYCAPGYPKLPDGYVRRIPNIEYIDDRVRTTKDTPAPAGWGAVPYGSPLHMMPWLKKQADELTASGKPNLFSKITEQASTETGAPRVAMFRCHPDWVIEPPNIRATVEMTGLTPEGYAQFHLPNMSIAVDYILGKFSGTRKLNPFMLVLLPEEKRFYLVYRYAFEFNRTNEEESLRLRFEN